MWALILPLESNHLPAITSRADPGGMVGSDETTRLAPISGVDGAVWSPLPNARANLVWQHFVGDAHPLYICQAEVAHTSIHDEMI